MHMRLQSRILQLPATASVPTRARPAPPLRPTPTTIGELARPPLIPLPRRSPMRPSRMVSEGGSKLELREVFRKLQRDFRHVLLHRNRKCMTFGLFLSCCYTLVFHPGFPRSFSFFCISLSTSAISIIVQQMEKI